MGRIKKYKIARRLGSGVYEKTQTQKFALAEQRRAKARTGRPKRPTDYGLTLIQKQRVRFAYGVSEKQLVNYVKKSFVSAKTGAVPSTTLFQLLEGRIDNVVYRSGIAKTRAYARQLVSHGHITLNGRKITVPSAQVRPGDVIAIREGSREKTVFANITDTLNQAKAPQHLAVDAKKVEVTVKGEPKNPDPFFNFQTVIEFYSR